jgi:site-specific recombinase XerD
LRLRRLALDGKLRDQSVCSSRAPTWIRNRALIVVLYGGGLRISEALALPKKDLVREAGTVLVLEGKVS